MVALQLRLLLVTAALQQLNGALDIWGYNTSSLRQSPVLIPLEGRHGWFRERGLLRRDRSFRRDRSLLRNGTLPVQGAVREVGYFYATIELGTPARTFALIIDTGSTITYVPCSDCKHCGHHQDEAFDPAKSTSAVRLTCNTPKCNCGSPPCQCINNKCFYSRSYAERSSSEGWMLEDHFGFPDTQGPVKLIFGCESGETGEIYRQTADGILGMGNNNNAFHSQLVEQKVIEDVFSLCFGYPTGGIMLLGDYPLPPAAKTIYTPLQTQWRLHYYNVKLLEMTVDGKKVEVDLRGFEQGYGTVLDSGTTFTYFPSAGFKAFAAKIDAYAQSKGLKRTPGADPQYNDVCWKGAPAEFDKLDGVFPTAEYVFEGNARLQLTPLRYLFVMRPGEYCLGVFDNGNAGALIGGITVRDILVTYDRRNNRVGFTPVNCKNFHNGFPPAAAASPASPLPPSLRPPPAATPKAQPMGAGTANASAGPAPQASPNVPPASSVATPTEQKPQPPPAQGSLLPGNVSQNSSVSGVPAAQRPMLPYPSSQARASILPILLLVVVAIAAGVLAEGVYNRRSYMMWVHNHVLGTGGAQFSRVAGKETADV